MFALTNAPTVFNVQLVEILFARTVVGIYKNALREKSNKIQKSFEYLQKLVQSMKITKKQNKEKNNSFEKYDDLLEILEYKDLKEEKKIIEKVIKKHSEKNISRFRENNVGISKSGKKLSKKISIKKPPKGKMIIFDNNKRNLSPKNNSIDEEKEDSIVDSFSHQKNEDQENYRSNSFNFKSYPKSKFRKNRNKAKVK
jgi:hypothetical protein